MKLLLHSFNLERIPIETSKHSVGRQLIDKFNLESKPGNERLAIQRVEIAIEGLGIPESKLARIRTAVGESTMNAMEHGNRYQPDLPVEISVFTSGESLSIFVTDQSGDQPIPVLVEPDLEAKLAGLQSPRGWGLFLIKQMVDEMHVTTDETHHSVELIFKLRGDEA